MLREIIKRKAIFIPLLVLGFVVLIILFSVFILLSSADRATLFSGRKTFSHDGVERTYLLSRPSADTNKIIIGLHGFGDTGRRFAYYTGLHNVVDENTLVVYPEATEPLVSGIKKGWNAGFCCGSGYESEIDDVGFIIELIAELNKKYANGQAKVYATGFSNGAFLTQRLVAEHPEIFSAIAFSSGSIGTTKERLSPKSPIPVLMMHGEKDTIVPFNGGPGSSDPDFVWLPFKDTETAWQEANGQDAETTIKLFPNNSHTWDGWRILNIWHTKPNASQLVIDFLYKH